MALVLRERLVLLRSSKILLRFSSCDRFLLLLCQVFPARALGQCQKGAHLGGDHQQEACNKQDCCGEQLHLHARHIRCGIKQQRPDCDHDCLGEHGCTDLLESYVFHASMCDPLPRMLRANFSRAWLHEIKRAPGHHRRRSPPQV